VRRAARSIWMMSQALMVTITATAASANQNTVRIFSCHHAGDSFQGSGAQAQILKHSLQRTHQDLLLHHGQTL